jgi:hypothetical protein
LDTLPIVNDVGFGWYLQPGQLGMFPNIFYFNGPPPKTTTSTGDVLDSIGMAFIPGISDTLRLVDGLDVVGLRVRLGSISPEFVGKTICLDTLSIGNSGEFAWKWWGFSWDDVTPAWLREDGSPIPDGGLCYEIVELPCIAPCLASPQTIQAYACQPVVKTFTACDCNGPLGFALVSGPGLIDPVSGEWTWDGPDGISESLPMQIEICNALGACDTLDVTINIANEPPEFVSGGESPVSAAAGEIASVTFDAQDDCPSGIELLVTDDGGVVGDVWIDGLTLFFTPSDPYDVGTRIIQVAVADGRDTSASRPATFEVSGGGSSCCGMYTGGMTGNVNCDFNGDRNLSDITVLIDHVYVTHSALCCLLNGDVNGDHQGPNLGDITRLIDFVYIGGEETAPCP